MGGLHSRVLYAHTQTECICGELGLAMHPVDHTIARIDHPFGGSAIASVT